jgi:hypothetical protein
MLVHLQETNGNTGALDKFDIMKNLIFLFLIPLIGFGQSDNILSSKFSWQNYNSNENLYINTNGKGVYSNANPIPIINSFPTGTYFSIKLGTFSKPLKQDHYIGFAPIFIRKSSDNKFHYYVGFFNSFEAAVSVKKQLKNNYGLNTLVAAYNNGVRILPSEAVKLLKLKSSFKYNGQVIISGTFKNSIIEDDIKANIKIQDIRTNKLIASYTVSNDGTYNIPLPNSGNYKFIVETPKSEKIHAGLVDAPPQDKLRALKQEIELFKFNGEEKLIIKDYFDQSPINEDEIIASFKLENRTFEEKPSEIKESLPTNNNQISSSNNNIDNNIPLTNIQSENTYALIIGNEDYLTHQTGLNREVNVKYASNDAEILKKYCTKTLGIRERQIKYLKDATAGQMKQGLAWINNLAKVTDGKANLIFYYAGHGLPDQETKTPYLMPVDVSGSYINLGISLDEVITSLSQYPTKKSVIFLDACFSGGARNEGLVAMRGVKIKPKEENLLGNLVILSSSSGNESSGSYDNKKHGMFTYFLLKKLQETKGTANLKEISDYLYNEVRKESALSGKIQTPQIQSSSSVGKNWESWTLTE